MGQEPKACHVPQSSVTFLTYCNRVMLPGCQVLAYSLFKREQLQGRSLIVLSDDPQVLDDPILHVWAHVFPIDGRPYKKLLKSPGLDRQHHGTFVKGFEGFRDYGCDRNVVLDADMVCTGNVGLLCDAQNSKFQAVCDGRISEHPGFVEFNAGMMSIPRDLMSDRSVRELFKIATREGSRTGGDQSVVNTWIFRQGIEIQYVPPIYNYSRRAFDRGFKKGKSSWRKRLISAHDIRLLHYVGRKPWGTLRNKSTPIAQLWLRKYREMRREFGL